ncbi:Protein FAR1-RELATED SEQUENCE 5, partial [Linum perenne]
DTVDSIQYATLACNKEGFRDKSEYNPKNKGKLDTTERLTERSETRRGCTALLRTKFYVDKDVYKIKEWIFSHNDDLALPQHQHFLKSKRHISDTHRQIAKMHNSVVISTWDSYDFMAMCSEGRANLGFTLQDLSNYVQALRQTPMEDGGEKFLSELFTEESSRNPSFFHRLQYDADNKIESVFWVDARMILDYSAFGDAITFDTTYRSNNQYRPLGMFFVPFIYYLCTFIIMYTMYEETTEGFKWVFNTFLECINIPILFSRINV